MAPTTVRRSRQWGRATPRSPHLPARRTRSVSVGRGTCPSSDQDELVFQDWHGPLKVAPFRSPVMADDEHIYPFSSATAIVHHECREDGDPPLARVSANHRCPCIVFSLYGGKFMTDASGAGEGQKEGGLDRVVCYISFGSMHIQTLAAQLNSADGSFRISDEFVFGLNSKQLQMVEGPHLRIQCFKLAKDQPSSTASFDVPVEQAKKTLIGCVEVDIRRLVCSPTPEVDKVVGGVDWGADGMITGYLRDSGKKNEDIFHRDGMGQLHRARLFFRCKSKPAGQDGDCAHVLSSDMWAPPALPDILNDVASAGTRARDRTGANDARDVCIAVMAASNGADGRSMSHGCNKAKGTKDSMQVSAADRTNERVSEEHSEDTESVSSTDSDSVQTASADIEGVLGVGGGWGQEHWRERLDKTMDSLAVSAAVIALVVLDVVLAVVYDLSSSTQTTLHATAEFKVGRFGADSLMIRTPPPRPPTHTLTHSHTYTHTHTHTRSLALSCSILQVSSAQGAPMSVRIVQGLILAGFLCELTLRLVAKRRRFFRGAWNILDLIVVVTSVRTQHVLALVVLMRARTHHTHIHTHTQTHTHTHTHTGGHIWAPAVAGARR